MTERRGRPPGRGGGPGRPLRFKLKHVEEALRKASGIPSVAAEILSKAYGSCTAATVRNYLNRNPKLRQTVEEQTDITLDLAETKLFNAISNGEDWAVKFYLETKGKLRGYSRRQEIAGVAGAPVVVTDARNWLADQLDQMESRLRPEPSGANGADRQGGEGEAPQETVH